MMVSIPRTGGKLSLCDPLYRYRQLDPKYSEGEINYLIVARGVVVGAFVGQNEEKSPAATGACTCTTRLSDGHQPPIKDN